MKFQFAPEVKQLILNSGSQIIVNLEPEECYACCGKRTTIYPFAQLGKPQISQLDEYKMLSFDDINVYVA